MATRDEWLLISEAAAIARVSPETVRFWIKRKTRPLPSVRPGRRRLIRRDVLDAFLASSGGKKSREGEGR